MFDAGIGGLPGTLASCGSGGRGGGGEGSSGGGCCDGGGGGVTTMAEGGCGGGWRLRAESRPYMFRSSNSLQEEAEIRMGKANFIITTIFPFCRLIMLKDAIFVSVDFCYTNG